MNGNEELVLTRTVCHQLVESNLENPGDLVAWMGAVQAQEYTMAKWALGIRLKGATLQRINEALATGEIIRTHIMRPTWHFVAGKDLRWMLQLSGARVRAAIDSWVKNSDPSGICEEEYTRSNDLIGKMLSGRRHLTREEIGEQLAEAGMAVENKRINRYLLRAEVERIVCSGGDRAGTPTYALVDEQVAAQSPFSEEEALRELALRYFQSHSPATLNDFVWWSGLPVTKAKQAISAAGDHLRRETFGGQEYWLDLDVQPGKTDSRVHLIPPFDEYLVGYKDRVPVIPLIHQPKAFNRWGIFYPVVVYKGRVVGNWSKIRKKGGINIEITLFDTEVKIHPARLKEAGERYLAFAGK